MAEAFDPFANFSHHQSNGENYGDDDDDDDELEEVTVLDDDESYEEVTLGDEEEEAFGTDHAISHTEHAISNHANRNGNVGAANYDTGAFGEEIEEVSFAADDDDEYVYYLEESVWIEEDDLPEFPGPVSPEKHDQDDGISENASFESYMESFRISKSSSNLDATGSSSLASSSRKTDSDSSRRRRRERTWRNGSNNRNPSKPGRMEIIDEGSHSHSKYSEDQPTPAPNRKKIIRRRRVRKPGSGGERDFRGATSSSVSSATGQSASTAYSQSSRQQSSRAPTHAGENTHASLRVSPGPSSPQHPRPNRQRMHSNANDRQGVSGKSHYSEEGSLRSGEWSEASGRTNTSNLRRHGPPARIRAKPRRRTGTGAARKSPGSSVSTVTTASSCEERRYTNSVAILGTMSGVGKSVIAAGICRVLANGGTNCAPFKAQNTGSGTSPALLPDPSRRKDLYGSFAARTGPTDRTEQGAREGKALPQGPPKAPADDQGWGQISTAQAMQAEACKILPRVDMNPLFFKSGERDMERDEALCAMIVMGKQILRETYSAFSTRIRALRNIVLDAHRSLATVTGAEVVVVQGAGSCSELHLMDGDIVNLPIVRRLKCPWFLVANDENGGVFAQVVGTKMCLSKRDWDLCVGVIVNKVKGDIEGYSGGLKTLKQMAGKPLFAIPFLENWHGRKEAGINIEDRLSWEKRGDHNQYNDRGETDRVDHYKVAREKPVVVVVAYPHSTISSDLSPLESDGRFSIEWRRKRVPKPYPATAAVILPGSRLPLPDLKWINDSGWADFIREHVAAGGTVLGMCGGYQMLGRNLKGENTIRKGIGLFPLSFTAKPAECKHLNRMKGQLYPSGLYVEGYELDCGPKQVVVSERKDIADAYRGMAPLLAYDNGKPEGMLLGRVKGTNIHGILRSANVRLELLVPKEDREKWPILSESAGVSIEDPLDHLARWLQVCGLDHDKLREMIVAEDAPQ